MRLQFLILAVCLVSLASGQGFFQGLQNFFRPSRQNQPAARPNRPPPNQQQFQPRPNNQQQPPQQFAQQPQQPFRQPQQQPPQQQQFNPQAQQARPQQFPQQARPQSQPTFVQQQTRPQSQPQQTAQFNSAVRANAASSSSSGLSNAVFASASTPDCPPLPAENAFEREEPQHCAITAPNHFWRGRGYIITFINTTSGWNQGCTKFTGIAADNFCKSVGGRAVSLDDNDTSEHFLEQAAIHAQRYFWTGGRLNHCAGVLTWPSGKQEGWVRGQRYWSTTGGSKSKGPQPDNRHATEDGHPEDPEKCLGVLNNFYADGIKWHDVACHHKKPTICEL